MGASFVAIFASSKTGFGAKAPPTETMERLSPRPLCHRGWRFGTEVPLYLNRSCDERKGASAPLRSFGDMSRSIWWDAEFEGDQEEAEGVDQGGGGVEHG
jgi:hypothetical protein